MKNTRRIANVLLALVMLFALAIPAFAETTSGTSATVTGQITINNAVAGQAYTAYKLLELESYDSQKGIYTYKTTNETVGNFFQFYSFTVSETKYYPFTVTDVNDANGTFSYSIVAPNAAVELTAEQKAALAKTLLANKDTYGITAQGDPVTATATTVVFEDLPLGYYLVDSSFGSLCALTTTDNEAEINEKNVAPTVTKTVKTDTGAYGAITDAGIGDTVEYRTIVTIPHGTESLVLHDTMEDSLTLDATSIYVYDKTNSATLSTSYYEVTTTCTDSCTFEITFKDGYLSTLRTPDATTEIYVVYKAVLNGNADIFSGNAAAKDENTGDLTQLNENTTYLSYANNLKTEISRADVKTYAFDLVKTDSASAKIEGAKFKLYDALTGGKEIAVVEVSNGVYRVAVDGETGVEIEAGVVTIQGLDAGTYYLEETVAPTGYNMLTSRVAITIAADGTVTATGGTVEEGTTTVKVVNNSGALLPDTGGMGTTIFYVAGSLLAVAAVVLLITKKRMIAGA